MYLISPLAVVPTKKTLDTKAGLPPFTVSARSIVIRYQSFSKADTEAPTPVSTPAGVKENGPQYLP